MLNTRNMEDNIDDVIPNCANQCCDKGELFQSLGLTLVSCRPVKGASRGLVLIFQPLKSAKKESSEVIFFTFSLLSEFT